jgi:patatin-like phospholipase/acyl hydrolase
MKILSVDGGGYLGLATAALLEETERHFGKKSNEVFDLFCGTSTGAIIALALAAGLSAREVRELYVEFGSRVFRNVLPGQRTFRTWILSLVSSMYDNRELRTALENAFKGLTFGDLLARRKFVVIPAFSLTNGRPRLFKTNHAPGLTTDSGYKLADVALASSAAPVFLPVVEIVSPISGIPERYCDGGIFANHPALLGYTEAIFHLGIPPNEVQILSISTPRSSYAEYEALSQRARRLRRGLLFGWRGPRLGSLFIESTSEIYNEIVQRLASRSDGRYERIVLRNPGGLELDLVSEGTTNTLVTIGASEAARDVTRAKLVHFFGV